MSNKHNITHIELTTKGGTSADILMNSDNKRLLDLFTKALLEVSVVFDDVDKVDAVRDFEAIVERNELEYLIEKRK